jgi:hypothetical protein
MPESSSEASNPGPQETTVSTQVPLTKGLAFWLVILSLCLIGFTSSLDGSIIAIALPKIATALASGDKYVGMANCFVIAQTSYNQLSRSYATSLVADGR